MGKEEHPDRTSPVPVHTKRSVVLSRSNLDECFGFALQTYVLKRGRHGLKERITYIDYVRDDSIAAKAGIQEGDVVVAINGFPSLLESHSALVKRMSSQLELRLDLLYQNISRILDLSVRSLQLQYILAEKYILLEQLEMQESSILHESEGSLSTVVRRARWLSMCQDISKSLNLCRKLLNKDNNQEFYQLCPEPTSKCCDVAAKKSVSQQDGMLAPRHALQMASRSFISRESVLLSVSASSHPRRWTSAGPPPPTPSKPGSFSDKYDKFLSRWPRVYAIHRMVVDGSRWCFADIKTYIRLKRELSNARQLDSLSVPELEVLVQSGGELAKMLSLVVVLQIPGPGDILILLLIFFPRHILTRHFWSDEQRKKFFQLDIERSLANTGLADVLGNPTSVDKVRQHKVEELNFETLVALAALHSIYPLPGVRNRFAQRCKAMRRLDKIMANNLELFTERQLHFHLFIRRINVEANATDNDLRKTLRKWIQFTRNVDDVAYLCAPIFFNQRKS
ncbi:hypothetical protein Q1695_010002 [Nippostrongylus brasiliensis]|nr:hypothetical protein Q1695_010002 [Nippostrongylus brasiliensis]